MKKVSGCIDVRALGRYDFEFYVDDDATDEEIAEKVNDTCDYYISYGVEPGYRKEIRTEEVYVKE